MIPGVLALDWELRRSEEGGIYFTRVGIVEILDGASNLAGEGWI